MWYDATSAAGTSRTSPRATSPADRLRVRADRQDRQLRWLWTWAWAMPKTKKNADNAAKFMLWASSKEYEELVGTQLGWSPCPSGKRESTYSNAEYVKTAEAFADITLKSIQGADPRTPRPAEADGRRAVRDYPGVRGPRHKVSQQVSAAIAGKTRWRKALAAARSLPREVAAKYKK